MNLYNFLVVIVSLSCGSLPPSDQIDPTMAALSTAGMTLGWIILCHVAARVVGLHVRDEELDPLVGAELLEKQLSAFRWLGLAVAVLCLAGFGLARTVESLPIVGASMFLQSLILLAPATLITLGTWSAEHRYGVLLGYTSPDARNHFRSLWQSFRGGMAWLVVPVVVLLGIADLVQLLPLAPETAPIVSGALILALVVLGLPWLIRRVFKTGPLASETESWVKELLAAVGIRNTRAVRWDTGGSTFNAMVAGFVPPIRTMLLSDRVLDELPPSQIAMVVLHEAAHLRRRHVPIRMLSILPAWLAGGLLSNFSGQHSWSLAAGSVVSILLTMLILRVVAYRTEFDADIQACRMAESLGGSIKDVPATYDEARVALKKALLRVTFDQPAARKATWLHPAVEDRFAAMQRHCEMPNTEASSAGTIA